MSQDLQLHQQHSQTSTPKGGATPGGTTFEEYKRAMSGEGNTLQDQTQEMLHESTREIIKKSNEVLRKSKSYCNVYDEAKTRAEKLDEALKKADDIMRDSQLEGSRYAVSHQGTLKRAGTTMIYSQQSNNPNTLEDLLEISRGRTGGIASKFQQQNLSSPSNNNLNNASNPDDRHQEPTLIDPPLQNVQQRIFHSLSPYATRNPGVSNSVFIPAQPIQQPTLQRNHSFSQNISLPVQLEQPSWLLEAQNSAYASIKPVILDNPSGPMKIQETKQHNQTQPSEILFASFAADFPQSNSALEESQKIINNSETTSNYDAPELGSMGKIVSNYIQKTEQDLRRIRNSEASGNQQQQNPSQFASSENSPISSNSQSQSISSNQVDQQNQYRQQQPQFLGNGEAAQEQAENIGNRRGTARFAASSVFFTPNTDSNPPQPLKQKPNSQSVYLDNSSSGTVNNTKDISILPISQQKQVQEEQHVQQHKIGFQEYISQIHQQLEADDTQRPTVQEDTAQMSQISQQNLQQDQIAKHSKILSASTYTPAVGDFSQINEKKQFKSVSSSPVNGVTNIQQSQFTVPQTSTMKNNLGIIQQSNSQGQQQASDLSPNHQQQSLSSSNSVNQAQPVHSSITHNSSQQQQQTQQSYSLSQDVVSSHNPPPPHLPSRQLANSMAVFPASSVNNPSVSSNDQLLVSRNQNRTFTQPGLNSWSQQQQLGDQIPTQAGSGVGYHNKDLGLGMTHSALYGEQYQAQQASHGLSNNSTGALQPLSEEILAKIGSQPNSFDANSMPKINTQNASKNNPQNDADLNKKHEVPHNHSHAQKQGKLEEHEKERTNFILNKDKSIEKGNTSREHTTHTNDNISKNNINQCNASNTKQKASVSEDKTIPKRDLHKDMKKNPPVEKEEEDAESSEKEKTKSEKRSNPSQTNDKTAAKLDNRVNNQTTAVSNQNGSKSMAAQGKQIDSNNTNKKQGTQDQSSSKADIARQSQQKQNTAGKTVGQQQSTVKEDSSKTKQQEDKQEISTKKQKPSGRDNSMSSSTFSKEGMGQNKHEIIKRNAVQIICFHIWQYVKRQRNREHRTELVQFIYYCIQTIQKVIRGYLERKSYKRLLLFRESLNAAFAGWKTRRILKIPQLKQIASEIQQLQLEKPHDKQLSGEKLKEKQRIQFINRRSNTAIQYQLCHQAVDGSQLINNQGQNKVGSPQRSSLKSSQKMTSPSPQVQRKSKDNTDGVIKKDEEKKKQPEIKNTNKDAWDDIPVGSKTTKKNEKMTGWEDAYPPEANLDSKQKEFIESHKKKSRLEDKRENKLKEDEKEETPKERPKNAWDDIPVGGHQKKGMEEEMNEFPTGDTPKRERQASSSRNKSSRKKKTLQDETKTLEQKEALQRRTKYDPRKAVEQAKQASQTEVDEKQKLIEEDKKNNDDDAGDNQEKRKKSKKSRKQSSNQVESDQKEQQGQGSESKGKRNTENTDEGDIEEDKVNKDKDKEAGDDGGEMKTTGNEKDNQKSKSKDTAERRRKRSSVEENKNSSVKSSGESNNEDSNDDDSNEEDKEKKTNKDRSVHTHKSFLRRKQHSPVFETLNWKNIKSRTDTGRNDLTQSQTLAIQSEKLHEKNIQLQQQQKYESSKQSKMPTKGKNTGNNTNNVMKQLSEKTLNTQKSNEKKKPTSKQGVGEVYYSELNYVDEDEDFWTSKKQATPAPFKLYGSNKHNVFSKIPTQAQNAPKIQYPVAPKLFTEYLPNKQQHKAIHQLSPTQPSQQIILSTSVNNQLPSQQSSSTNIRDSGFRVSAMNSNQNIPANVAVFAPSKMKDQQNAKLPSQAGPLIPTGGVLNMAERRQHQKENKLSSIQQHLQQQQQQLQQQIQQLQQQEDIELSQQQYIQSQAQQQGQQNQNGKTFSQPGSSSQIAYQTQTSVTAAPSGPQQSQLNVRQQEISQHKQIQKRSEEDSREIQMRSFQQQQLQHKQNFVFPPTLFKHK